MSPVAATPKPKKEARAAPQPASASPQRRAAAPASPDLPAYKRESNGRALDGMLLHKFSARFQRDFSGVHVHSHARDEVERFRPGARAVTIGEDVYLASDLPAGAEGEALLAHELTHVVQQQGAESSGLPPGDRAADPLEREARHVAAEFAEGRSVSVAQRSPHRQPQAADPEQKEEVDDEEKRLNAAMQMHPELSSMMKRSGGGGIGGWIKDKVSEIVKAIFNFITEPIELISGAVDKVGGFIKRLVSYITRCVTALAKGDCSVLHEGFEYIEKVIDEIKESAPVKAVMAVFERIKKVFGDFIDWASRIGSAIWDFIKDKLGPLWNGIMKVVGWIGDIAAKVWGGIKKGYHKLKSWLFGDDDEDTAKKEDGDGGVFGWIKKKILAAWDKVTDALSPVLKPIIAVGKAVGAIIAVPFQVAGAGIGAIIDAIKYFRRLFAGGIAGAREELRKNVLPKLVKGITDFAAMLAGKASALTGGLLSAKQFLDDSAKKLQDVTILGLHMFAWAGDIVGKIAGFVGDLVSWANEALEWFVGLVNRAAQGFAQFLLAILDVLEEIAQIMRDIMRLIYLGANKLWKLIPACIRDPLIDFLGRQILGRIAIFQAIAGTPEAWAQTKADVAEIIRTIFVDFDLIGAMKKAFRLLLRVLNVPLELLMAVFAKMEQAWDVIKSKPVEFIKNLFRTIALALKGFFTRILTHLAHGVVGWLTSQLSGTGIVLPTSWTDLGQIFQFIASVLGLSLDHVFQLMEQRISPEIVKKIRAAVNFMSGAWDWIVLVAKGDFATLWQRIREKLSDLKDQLIQGVIDWIMDEVVGAIMMQLVTTADPTGISEAIMLIIDIYRTIKTAVQYMRQILEMVQRMLDSILNIAAGVLQPAADLIEDAMDRGMPVVIGFLANLAGIGGIGEKIRNVVTKIRDKVDAAILWLIDKAKSAVEFVAGTVKSAVSAVKEWWRERFSTRIGDEGHVIAARGAGPAADIYIESDPKPLGAFLDELEANPKANKDVIKEIRGLLTKISDKKKGSMGETAGKEIAGWMGEIADKLKSVLPDGTELPPSVVIEHETRQVQNCTVGEVVKVEPLSLKPPAEGKWRGSEPGYGNTFFRDVNRRVDTYIQGHLLNHHLYGPGKDFNLVPISRKLNTRMSSSAEELVKGKVLGESKVVSYEVRVQFGTWSPTYTHIPAENDLPLGITMRAYEMKKQKGKDGKDPKDWEIDKSAAIFADMSLMNTRGPDEEPTGRKRLKRVNLNLKDDESLKAFDELYGIGEARARAMRDNSPYQDFDDIVRKLKLPDPDTVRERWFGTARSVEVAFQGNLEWE